MRVLGLLFLLSFVSYGQSTKPIPCDSIDGTKGESLTYDNEILILNNEAFTGVIKYCYDSGNLNLIMTAENGKLEGKSISYFESGNVEIEKSWLNGIEHGPSKRYHENGLIKISGSWVKGSKDGVWIYYSKNEDIIKKEIYENGVLISCDGNCL